MTTYDYSEWYEWYGEKGWNWARLRYCFPTQTDGFKLTVFRDKAQYWWGSAWYSEKEAYPAYSLAIAHVDSVESKQRVLDLTSPETARKEYSIGGKNEKLQPGKYMVRAIIVQSGPYWLNETVAGGATFDIAVSSRS